MQNIVNEFILHNFSFFHFKKKDLCFSTKRRERNIEQDKETPKGRKLTKKKSVPLKKNNNNN